MFKHPLQFSLAFTLISVCLTTAVSVMAAPENASPTTQIEADALKYNEKQRLSTFTGAVKLVRGDLRIQGDRLDLQEFDGGRQKGVATGKPAQFEKEQAQADSPNVIEKVRGFANKITYDTANDTLVLEGNAKLQRWRNGKLNDETQGQRITYVDASGVFTVEGSPSASQPKRVTATIGPKPAKDAP